VNGESSVQIDRGQWLYRFALDTGSIAIFRARRAGQDLVPAEVWRSLAIVGVSDAFIVPVAGGWQPFIELTEGRQRWALAKRPSMDEAQTATRHFLGTLADAVCHASQGRGVPGEKEGDSPPLRVPEPPLAPAEDAAAEVVLSHARSARESSGWELIYSRQRLLR
jgi:hypothetical protein